MSRPISRRYLLASMPALIAAAKAPHRAASQRITHTLTLAEERYLEPIYLRGYEQQRGTAPTPRGRRIEDYLAKVGARLTRQHLRRPMPFSFHFDPDPGFKSAMAIAGGAVVVGSGLLSIADSEDALACVLGHEIMHVDLGHTTKRIFDVQDRDHLPDSKRATINPYEFGSTHTPEQELAADREGFRLAAKAGYSPYAARRLLQYLDQIYPNPNPRPGQLTIARRIEQLDGEIASNHWEKLAESRRPLALPDWG